MHKDLKRFVGCRGKMYTHIGLGRAELELNKTDPGLLHPDGTTSALDDGLCKDKAIDQLGVLDRTADLLDNADVLEVDVLGGLEIYRLGDSVDGHGAEEVRVL